MSIHVLQYHHFLLSIPAWIPWTWIMLIVAIIVGCAIGNWLLNRQSEQEEEEE